jgi:hypothetical protein
MEHPEGFVMEKIPEPPAVELRRPMMARALPVLKANAIRDDLAVSMMAMIEEGHLLFVEPDVFVLTTTGMLLGAPEELSRD